MKPPRLLTAVLFLTGHVIAAPTHPPGVTPVHYVSLSGSHIPPFTTWENVATNIQDAVDVTDDGDCRSSAIVAHIGPVC
jgi:hypothetical protein